MRGALFGAATGGMIRDSGIDLLGMEADPGDRRELVPRIEGTLAGMIET